MKWFATFLVFLFLFGLYFIEIPIADSLPGKVDSWFYVATFEYVIEALKAIPTGMRFGNSLHPESSHLPFGNFSPGLAVIYGAFRFVGFDMIWSFWALLSITFAGNAIGASILFHSLKIRFWPAVSAGILVSCNNYTIANIDNIDALFWTPGLLSIASLVGFDRGFKSSLSEASLLLGSQILFSSYLFLISSLFWFPYVAKWVFQIATRVFERKWIHLLVPFFVISVFISPFLYMYFLAEGLTAGFNPAAMEGVDAFTGLHIPDLVSYLPSTLYSNIFIEVENNWYEKAHCAGLGFLFPLAGLVGLFNLKRGFFRFGLFLIFLMIAIGPVFYYEGLEIKTPVFWLSSFIEFNHFFRINIRALLAVVVLLGFGFAYLLSIKERSLWVMLALTVVVLVENVPLHHRTYASREIIDHVAAAASILTFAPDDVILNLPSSFYTSLHPSFTDVKAEYNDPEMEVVHEYSYMLFQTMTGASVLNGFTGFIPNSRIENQIKILQLDNDSIRNALFLGNNIDYVLLHLDWMYDTDGWGSENFFIHAMKEHDVVFENEHFKLFRVTPSQK